MALFPRIVLVGTRLNVVSSNLAIGAATSFVFVAAVMSVALDPRVPQPPPLSLDVDRDGLGLRGTIPPTDTPVFFAPNQAETSRAPRFG